MPDWQNGLNAVFTHALLTFAVLVLLLKTAFTSQTGDRLLQSVFVVPL